MVSHPSLFLEKNCRGLWNSIANPDEKKLFTKDNPPAYMAETVCGFLCEGYSWAKPDTAWQSQITMALKIQQDLPENCRQQAALLLLEQFENKLLPILGNQKKGERLLSDGIQQETCFVALEGNILAGFLAYQAKSAKFIQPTFYQISEIYGLWSGLLRALGLSLFNYNPGKNEIYIEAAVIHPAYQNKGIGTSLFGELFQYAKNNNFHKTTLMVIENNIRAKQLYERLGFYSHKPINIFPMNFILDWDFSHVSQMEKIL